MQSYDFFSRLLTLMQFFPRKSIVEWSKSNIKESADRWISENLPIRRFWFQAVLFLGGASDECVDLRRGWRSEVGEYLHARPMC